MQNPFITQVAVIGNYASLSFEHLAYIHWRINRYYINEACFHVLIYFLKIFTCPHFNYFEGAMSYNLCQSDQSSIAMWHAWCLMSTTLNLIEMTINHSTHWHMCLSVIRHRFLCHIGLCYSLQHLKVTSQMTCFLCILLYIYDYICTMYPYNRLLLVENH